jgi:hypothetical protein
MAPHLQEAHRLSETPPPQGTLTLLCGTGLARILSYGGAWSVCNDSRIGGYV